MVVGRAVDDDNVALLLRAGSGLAGAGLIVGVLHYWPTRRRPPRLYHLTTRAAADAATVDTHADGTFTVALRPRGRGRPAYFLPAPPCRRAAVLFNLRAEPEVCIELVDVDYAGVQVRRRVTGAYALQGLVAARAIVHPFPPEPG